MLFKEIERVILGESSYDDYDTNNSTTLVDHCFSYFEPSNCYFPESDNGTSAGIGLCANILLPNSTCESNFMVTAGATYDEMCDMFLDAADQLPPPASLLFDGQCPILYMPRVTLYSVTFDSTEENYCSSAMGVCTAPQQTDDGLLFDACMLGSTWKFPVPFQFEGSICNNYTELEALLETKEEIAEEIAEFWPPEKWM